MEIGTGSVSPEAGSCSGHPPHCQRERRRAPGRCRLLQTVPEPLAVRAVACALQDDLSCANATANLRRSNCL